MDLDDLVTSIDIIDMFIFWVVLNLSHFRVSGSAMTPPPQLTQITLRRSEVSSPRKSTFGRLGGLFGVVQYP